MNQLTGLGEVIYLTKVRKDTSPRNKCSSYIIAVLWGWYSTSWQSVFMTVRRKIYIAYLNKKLFLKISSKRTWCSFLFLLVLIYTVLFKSMDLHLLTWTENSVLNFHICWHLWCADVSAKCLLQDAYCPAIHKFIVGTHLKDTYLAWANKSFCSTALTATFSILTAFLFFSV